jgi:DNA primase
MKLSIRSIHNSMRLEIDPRQFYEYELGVKFTSGKDWQAAGKCPFHDDAHAGSFRVSLSSGAFFCHACKASGASVVDFTKLYYGASYKEAIQRLRREWQL